MNRPVMVIAGASGVVGQHLMAAASARYDVRVLTRRPKASYPAHVTPVVWQPQAAWHGERAALAEVAGALEGAYAVVNLAGSSLADGRLGEVHKRRMLESRIGSTDTLIEACKRVKEPPKVWFQASATGYYGDAGERALGEDAPRGETFLAMVCAQWEAAATRVSRELSPAPRLCVGRMGVVFAPDAAAWQRLLLPFRLFVGGPLGSGRQWYAWIHADDLAGAVLHLLETPTSAGVYNLCAPQPVQQRELAKQVAARIRRPGFIPAPRPALRLALGGVADTLLLASTRALPVRLEAEGFGFMYKTLEAALAKLL